jgi:hypothetical protein
MIDDLLDHLGNSLFQHRLCSISGTIIYHNDFAGFNRRSPNSLDNLLDRILLIITGDNDRNFHPFNARGILPGDRSVLLPIMEFRWGKREAVLN